MHSIKETSDFDKLVACIVGKDTENFLEILNKSSVNLNSKDNKGWTLLHYAAQYSATELGKLLVSKGAEVEAKDNYGNNVLWRATFASNGKGEFIKFLLSKGADRFVKNDSGISAVELANTIANYDVKQYFPK